MDGCYEVMLQWISSFTCCDWYIVHFLPFFFFFPPELAPIFDSAVAPPIFTSPLSSIAAVATFSAAGTLKSSAVSGRAAICLPNLPKLPIRRPTSAPLLVLYCRHVPDSGSYVFNMNVTVTSSGFCNCGGGDDVRVELVGLDACFSA